jgi:hypothetical protein
MFEDLFGFNLASNSQYRKAVSTRKEVPVRTRRFAAGSIDPFAAHATRADSSPIFAVLAREPVFEELARDAHAQFLAHGRFENLADLLAFFTGSPDQRS